MLEKETTNQIHKMKTAQDYLSETSQRELASGILKQAAQDLRRFHGATSAIERELYLDAYRWVISDDCSWPFSFLNVCQLLNLAPESLRQELLTDASLGLFSYLARRGGRAARSFQIFFNRIFTTSRNPIAVDPVPLTHVPIA
jgi:hypothetical protein